MTDEDIQRIRRRIIAKARFAGWRSQREAAAGREDSEALDVDDQDEAEFFEDDDEAYEDDDLEDSD
jgi:hypothetical protein